jgi:hypothetical protein
MSGAHRNFGRRPRHDHVYEPAAPKRPVQAALTMLAGILLLSVVIAAGFAAAIILRELFLLTGVAS